MMKISTKEKAKSLLLMSLILLSVFQVGIYWDRQSQWIPFRFFTELISQQKALLSYDLRQVEKQKLKYFKPSRIVISDEQSVRWDINAESPVYKSLWEDIRIQYLPQILKRKPVKIMPKEDWYSLLETRNTMIELESEMKRDLLNYFIFGNHTSAIEIGTDQNFSSIQKIIVVPSEDVNDNINTLYVYSPEGIYRFVMTIPEGALPKAAYNPDYETLKKENINHPYKMNGEVYRIKNLQEDQLISIEEDDFVQIPSIEEYIPDSMQIRFDNLEKIQESILLYRKDSLLPRMDKETGDAVFSDTENIFRLNNEGVFTYQFLPEIKDAKNDRGGALLQALAFIEMRKKLLDGVEVVLSDVPEIQSTEKNATSVSVKNSVNSSVFTFSFVYRFQNTPIYNYNSALKILEAPITISATSDRVTNCRWVVRSFKESKKYSYNLFFNNFYTQLVSAFPNLKNSKEMLSNIRKAYVTGLVENPNWVVFTPTKSYVLPMLRETN
jgi:hypothetical protein